MCIKELRITNGLTQQQVSERVKIAQPTYANIENGERKPSVAVAKRIAEVLGFDWTLLFEEKPERGA